MKTTLALIIVAAISLSAQASLLDGASGTVAYGKNTSSGNDVYAVCVGLPLNDYFSVGLIGANDGGRWLASAATVQLGSSLALTDKINLCGAAGSGMAYNLDTHNPTLYSFTDVGLDYKLDSKWTVGAKVIVANVADKAGVDVLGAFSINYKF